ncbi:MAG: PAS domain-containing protein [Deltaproteobacteria bacterium]|nr:PAS domain-containing protein [Deltaproteobacteria bacterium]
MRWGRLGLRREVLVLLPAAILLLALVSTFTLLSYRSAVQVSIEERREEAARLAVNLARFVGPGRSTSSLELLAMVPQARGVAILDGAGGPVMASGDLAPGELLPRGLGQLDHLPVSFGPGKETAEAVVAIASLKGVKAKFLRLELPATHLGAHQKSIRLLGLVVVGVNSAVLLLVLFFLRHLLSPWEELIERARRAAPGEQGEPVEQENVDDVSFLLSAFERALAAEAKAVAGSAEEDIAALQRTLTQSLESGLLLLDRDGRVLTINEAGKEVLGRAAAPASGSTLEAVLGSSSKLVPLLRQAVRDGQGFKRREVTVAVAEQQRTLGLSLHPLRRDDREVRGYLVLFADLTEAQRQAKEVRLQEGLTQLGEMAAGVAHELRNSLATLKGYLTLIERRPGEEEISDYLQEIRHETDQLQRVLEDFLLFTRPGSARPESVALDVIVRRSAADPSIAPATVQLEFGANLEARLLGDEQLLERAVRNLISNAARSHREAGVSVPIEVSLTRGADGLKLVVEDHGPGFPEAVRERLFQPFVSEFRGGVGLGLALTHRIVSLHGGRIYLDSPAGSGARIVMEFPFGDVDTKGNQV